MAKKGRKGRKGRKGKKSGWCIKAGKKRIGKFRKKTNAKKAAKARRKRGLKARVVKCK